MIILFLVTMIALGIWYGFWMFVNYRILKGDKKLERAVKNFWKG
jgi:hypothetical protein